MEPMDVLLAGLDLNRQRTLALLDTIASLASEKALGWRPGPGRAHIAWQLMHIGVTEELFASERLAPDASPRWPELVSRFRGGSKPDNDVPTDEQIRDLLSKSRSRLLKTLKSFSVDQWNDEVAQIRDRRLTFGQVMGILSWHEAHHQGQAHLTLNLFRTR